MIECPHGDCPHHEAAHIDESGPYCWDYNQDPKCPLEFQPQPTSKTNQVKEVVWEP